MSIAPGSMRRSIVQRPKTQLTTRVQRPQVVRAGVAGISSWLPPQVVTSDEVERRIAEASVASGFVPKAGIVQKLTGVRERRYKLPHEDASDLAVNAARGALEDAGLGIDDIDLIIFASTSQDLIEPATSHIVSAKLGGSCTVFDVKNACNSFVNGMEVADGLIRTGKYERVLVCTGEGASECIRWDLDDVEHMKNSFAGFTFGDAGAAVVLDARSDGTGILYTDMVAASSNWGICTIKGGGTMNPHDPMANYVTGDGNNLKDAFVNLGPQIIIDAFQRTNTTFEDYDVVLFHQVTEPFLDIFMQISGVPESRIVRTVDTLGNIASATMPLQLHRAVSSGQAGPGSKVMAIGLGAGISLAVTTIQL
ncbi:MAG: Ketoacyl-ACP synthase [Thermoleophilia bacterium]|nr:Ketoacyl-ACP synthase [Thermoleophilia bacterium]MCZ4496684.1 Ketoacyl-ACP synthase [Thermoleophilia bacterium]